MGFNTPVVILNDFIHEIKNDPKFGEKVYHAVLQARRHDETRMHGFRVLPSHHADYTRAVIVGGNTIRDFDENNPDDLEIVRRLADRMGLRLVLKASRRAALAAMEEKG